MTSEVVVYGATGITGTKVCQYLAAAGVSFAVAGRNRDRLQALATRFTEVRPEVRVAAADDTRALAAACSGARVVVSCAGPFAQVGSAVVSASLDAGAHYLDSCGEHQFLRDVYERFDSIARRRGCVAVPGMAFEIALGDLAAHWAAAQLAVDLAPEGRLGEGSPVDEVLVAYAFTQPALSAGTQLSLADILSRPAVEWRHQRWEPTGVFADERTVNFGSTGGGTRRTLSFPSGEIITVPRHVAAHRVQAFLAIPEIPWLPRATRMLSQTAPWLLGPRVRRWLDGVLGSARDGDFDRTRFAIWVQARRNFSTAEVRIVGTNPYATTAAILTWAVQRLLVEPAAMSGVCAPAQLWPVPGALHALAEVGGMQVSTSFPRGDRGITST